MAMRMISSKHVFGGSMKRFKRIPFIRKGYVDVPATASKSDMEHIEEVSVPTENEPDVVPVIEQEVVEVSKKNKYKKHRAAESSGENNEVKNEDHE